VDPKIFFFEKGEVPASASIDAYGFLLKGGSKDTGQTLQPNCHGSDLWPINLGFFFFGLVHSSSTYL
jgi:hypothetical protein